MRYVVLYESAADVLARAPEHSPAHLVRCRDFAARGTLLGYGTFGDPQAQGSMAIFTTHEAAEDFVRGDPFVEHGVVSDHEIREWNDALSA